MYEYIFQPNNSRMHMVNAEQEYRYKGSGILRKKVERGPKRACLRETSCKLRLHFPKSEHRDKNQTRVHDRLYR